MNPLSYSQIRTFLQCPLRFHFEFVEKREAEFISADLLLGQVIHRTLSEFGLRYMSGEPISSEFFGVRFLNLWQDLRQQCPLVQFGQKDAGEYEAKGMVLMDLFCQDYLPEQILGVEEPFDLLLDGIPFRGRIDWLEENSEQELILVVFKTASRKPTYSISAFLQPVLYALALQQLGWAGSGCQIRLITLVKTQKPLLDVYTFTPERSHFAMAKEILRGVYSAIQAGVVYPNPSYYCQTCPFQQACQMRLQNSSFEEENSLVYPKVA